MENPGRLQSVGPQGWAPLSVNTPSQESVFCVWIFTCFFPCPRILTGEDFLQACGVMPTFPCWTLLSFPRGAGGTLNTCPHHVTQGSPAEGVLPDVVAPGPGARRGRGRSGSPRTF